MTASSLQKAQLVAPLTPAKNATRLQPLDRKSHVANPKIEMNSGPKSYDVRPQLTPSRAVKSTSEASAMPEGIRVSSPAWQSVLGVVLIFGSFFAALFAQSWLPALVLDGGQPW